MRRAREDQRMTQQDVADRLDITRSAYANIELGRNTAGVEHLIKLTAIFDKPIHYFLGLPAPPPEEITITELEEKINLIYDLLAADRLGQTSARPLLGTLLDICRQLPADTVKQVVDFARYQLDRAKNQPVS